MLLDVALLVLEYLGLSSIQIAFKALVYSVKLKMEFAILNKLVESSNLAQRSFSESLSNAVAQVDDQSSSVVARECSQDHFDRSTLSRRCDDGKIARESCVSRLQNTSARATHHSRSISEMYLSQPHVNTTYPTALGRVTSDSYHDTLKAISKTQP